MTLELGGQLFSPEPLGIIMWPTNKWHTYKASKVGWTACDRRTWHAVSALEATRDTLGTHKQTDMQTWPCDSWAVFALECSSHWPQASFCLLWGCLRTNGLLSSSTRKHTRFLICDNFRNYYLLQQSDSLWITFITFEQSVLCPCTCIFKDFPIYCENKNRWL